MKFMILFIIWEYVIYYTFVIFVRHFTDYKIKDEIGKRKIDSLLNIVGGVIGIVPVMLGLFFVFKAISSFYQG